MTLLVGRQEGHPACKKTEWWSTGVVVCLERGATCIWPSWCHCHSVSLAPVKSRLVLPFWYWLTQVVLEKRPLNGSCCCYMYKLVPWVLWRCWLGDRKGIRWWGAGVAVCLERGADLHMVQLMPLQLTVSCFSKIQIGFTFLVPAHLGSPGKGPLNGCVCVPCIILLILFTDGDGVPMELLPKLRIQPNTFTVIIALYKRNLFGYNNNNNNNDRLTAFDPGQPG